MSCCLPSNLFGRGRFLTKIFAYISLWALVTFAVYQLRSIPLDVQVPHLNSRLLLQKRYEFHDSTTEGNDQEPFVDRSPSLSEDKLVEDIQKRMPSLPIIYWNKLKNKNLGVNSSCARSPSLFDLEFNNVHWQTLRTTNGTFQFFGAYLDVRPNNRLGSTVRILGCPFTI